MTRIFKERDDTQKEGHSKTNASVPGIPVPDDTGDSKPACSQGQRRDKAFSEVFPMVALLKEQF